MGNFQFYIWANDIVETQFGLMFVKTHCLFPHCYTKECDCYQWSKFALVIMFQNVFSKILGL